MLRIGCKKVRSFDLKIHKFKFYIIFLLGLSESMVDSSRWQIISNKFGCFVEAKWKLFNIKLPSFFDRFLLSDRSHDLPPMIIAYDVIIRSCVASYVELSFSIDSQVFRQANKVSILPTFYVWIFRLNVVLAAFSMYKICKWVQYFTFLIFTDHLDPLIGPLVKNLCARWNHISSIPSTKYCHDRL